MSPVCGSVCTKNVYLASTNSPSTGVTVRRVHERPRPRCLTTSSPMPNSSESTAPDTGPRGVWNVTSATARSRCPSVSRSRLPNPDTPCTVAKCAMSTVFSNTSCGWDRNTQRACSGAWKVKAASSLSGILGNSHSGSVDACECQTNIAPARSTVGHARSRAVRLTVFAYGISTFDPAPSKRQPWNGQVMQSSVTVPPTAISAPRWGQYASSTYGLPESPR